VQTRLAEKKWHLPEVAKLRSNRVHRHDPPDEFGHTHALPQRFGTHRVDQVLGGSDGRQAVLSGARDGRAQQLLLGVAPSEGPPRGVASWSGS
jgi:hypothetical protein